jgi:molybdate transport system ATP-binding protein
MRWELDLHKQLRHGSARFEIDLHVASDAPRLVLFGPSGAGKTQALKMIAGIVRPDRGRVVVNGRTLFDSERGVDLPASRRRFGYVFQDYALFPHLTVRQNVAFARSRGWRNPSRGAAEAEVVRWIEAFQLAPVADHFPHQISGGQRQRVALARALLNKPHALLLDEPFAALDRGLRQRLREELLALQAGLRIPMLMITHDDDDIRAFADDVVHLAAGRVDHGADRCHMARA